MTAFKQIDCGGSHYEMGKAQGEALKENIRESVSHFLASEVAKAAGKRFAAAGSSLFKVAGKISRTAMKLSSTDCQREWRGRLEGIADGAGLDRSLLTGLQSLEAFLAFPLGMSGCTTVGITAGRSAGEGPLLLKNYDIAELLRPSTFMRCSLPAGKLRSFEMAVNVLPGSHVVMNEAGLCISYNFGMVRFMPRPGTVPTYITQYAAENFSTTAQVVEWVAGEKSASGCILTVLDAGSDLRVIEKAGGKTATRGPIEGVTVATNHFLTPGLAPLDYSVKTVFGRRAPPAVRGMSVQLSNETRLTRALELLKEGGGAAVSTMRLFEISRDHSGRPAGSENTICRHHEAMMTLGSIVLAPLSGKAWVCAGSPCEGRFEEIKVF